MRGRPICRTWILFFKQKSAYEMRISDWSSDVCSSDLAFAGAALKIILYAVRSPSLRQRLRNQLPAVRYAIKRNETAHARTLRGAQKGFIQRLEPIAQSFEPTLLADRINNGLNRSEEHTSELQSLMRISYAVFCLKK